MAEIKEMEEMEELFDEMDEPDEFKVRDELKEKRKDINSFKDLVSFLEYVKNNCNCGYGAAPRSIAQATAAVAWYFASEFGITGFQAGFVMWDFIREWIKEDNKCGLRLVDFDDMLYPQYDDKFDKTINIDTWNALQEQAKKKIEKDDADDLYTAHSEVRRHWQSIVDGEVPFGYVVKED